MLLKLLTQRAAEIRRLLARGAFEGARVPLRNGGTLPAVMFAKVALGDVDRLTSLEPSGQLDGTRWGRLAEDIELLHAVALGRGYASAEQGRVHV